MLFDVVEQAAVRQEELRHTTRKSSPVEAFLSRIAGRTELPWAIS